MKRADKGVSLVLDRPRVLKYQHRDLRDAVNTSGKTIVGLLDDVFGGWPYLLQYGLRWKDSRLTLDDCSALIERWIEQDGNTLRGLSDKLIEAVEQTGFIKIQRPDDPEEADATASDPRLPTT
jgi:hypothetical protein